MQNVTSQNSKKIKLNRVTSHCSCHAVSHHIAFYTRYHVIILILLSALSYENTYHNVNKHTFLSDFALSSTLIKLFCFGAFVLSLPNTFIILDRKVSLIGSEISFSNTDITTYGSGSPPVKIDSKSPSSLILNNP